MLVGKHINRYYFKYSGLLFLGLLSLIVVDIFQLKVPEIYRMVVNGINRGQVMVEGVNHEFNRDFLLEKICAPMIFIILIMVVGRFLWRITILGSAIGMERNVRDRMFDKAKDLSHQYYQTNKVGNLMSLFTNDLDTVQECFGWGYLMLFDAIILGGLAIAKMWRMNPILTLFTMIPMFFLLGSSCILGKYMMKKWDLRQESFSKLSDFAQESFSGIAVVKAFVKEAKELLSFEKINRENEEANISFARSSVLLKILVTLFVESVITVILGYGGWLVYQGMFDAGQLIEFLGYFSATVWPIMAISELIDMISRGKASLNRISQLLDAKQDVKDQSEVEHLENIKGTIEFRNLSFCYPEKEVPALENISFTVQAGEHIGIVGKTGCGKSTLVDLIVRTYNVEDGTLFIDGKDVNRVFIHDVRLGCAYVPQDNFLFSDTIENNIAFGVEERGKDEIVQAATDARVDSNIREFKNGYETVLGERGVTVSGGQKQRISIARALIKDAPILILDDSLSAVDTITEKEILEKLKERRKDKTTILIAHRVSTIEKMDKILYLEEGRLVSMGSHKELCETCPEYLKMVEQQRLEEERGRA